MKLDTNLKISLFDRIVNNSRIYRDGVLRGEVIIVASILLSVWIIAFHPTINKDGILYLLTAKDYLEGGFRQAFSTYFWPFYSIAFAILHQVTALPLHYAAYIVSMACFSVISYAFVSIVREFGGDRRVQFLALLIVLFQPIVSDYRASIVRDPAFYAFMLLALLETIRFSKIPSTKSQLKWFGYVVIAFLARPEMLLIAVITPLGLFLCSQGGIRERFNAAIRISLLPFLIGAALFFLGLNFYPEMLDRAKPAADIVRYSSKFVELYAQMSNTADAVSLELFKYTSTDDAIYGVYSASLTVLGVNIVRAITPIYALVLFIFWFNNIRLPIENNSRRLVQMYAVTIFSYLALFIFSNGFMLERYCFQIMFLFLLFVPFCVDNLLTRYGSKRYVWILFYLVLSGYVLDTTINSDSKKAYIDDAAEWIKNSKEADGLLITNIPHIAYFGQSGDAQSYGAEMEDNEIWVSDWLSGYLYALKVKAGLEEAARMVITAKNSEVVKEFVNKDGDRVVIFKVN